MERTVKSEMLRQQLPRTHIIDMCRKVDRDASREQEVVLYCMRGGSVSNSVVDALQAKGLNARYFEGGIEDWKATGGEVAAK